ncbi:MAG: acyl-CoA thioesterase [Epsilonproteobacteria bacterium]|nr:MAG: acyl-CoA thioesterase [Campylobacterota bacterium]
MKELSLKGRVFPSDLNHQGSVFGGWVMSKMDKASSIAVENIIRGKAVTVHVSEINFKQPIYNGNIFIIYTEIVALGKSSITINVEVQVTNHTTYENTEVTNAQFKFVSVDERGNSIPLESVLRPDLPKYVEKLLNK